MSTSNEEVLNLKLLSFKGGTHPHDNKEHTADKPIRELLPSKIMVYPMSQHIGAPCEPIVEKGDRVLMGQKIGESTAFVSAPVHSTVSGTVIAIEPRLHPNGTKVMSVIVENDFKDELIESIRNYEDTDSLTKEEKLSIIREAGIVGHGGATFPVHIKLNPPQDKKIDCCIVNGAECEPYLTSDYRVMLKSPNLILDGLKEIMKILGVNKAYIGIEDNKSEAIKVMQERAKDYDGIEVCVLKTKYPQGSEKHLIKAICGREVPSGKLPADVGVVVNNIDTCTAIYNALKFRQPVFHRVVTVAGSAIGDAGNFRVRLGTSFEDILNAASYDAKKAKKVIMGGPMMGMSIADTGVPAIKGTSAILAFGEEELVLKDEVNCFRCGRCVENCPMGLVPVQLNSYAKIGDIENCLKYDIMDCIECGVCSFNCPCSNHITQRIKITKKKIAASRSKK